MNWKNKTIYVFALMLLPFSIQAASNHDYQRYQQLQQQLTRDPKAALIQIRRFQKQNTSSDHTVRQMAAYLYLQACIELGDQQCAVIQANKLLDLPLETRQQLDLLKLSSQLYFQLEHYQQTLDYSERWLGLQQKLEQAEPDKNQMAEVYTLRAYSAYRLQQYKLAINEITKAISNKTTENRHRFLLALYQEQKLAQQEHQLLQQMVILYPDKNEYWERLGQSFIEQGNSRQAMAVFGSAYKANKLSTKSILQYTKLLIENQAATRAVTILEEDAEKLKSEEHWPTLMVHACLLSRQREKALDVLEQQSLADNNPNKKLALRSQLAYTLGNWQAASKLLSQQQQLEPDNDYWKLLLAVSLYEQGALQQARQSLSLINSSKYKAMAEQWLAQIDYLAAS